MTMTQTKAVCLSSVITAKKELFFFDKIHLFDTYKIEDGRIQRAIEDVIAMVKSIAVRSKKQASVTFFFIIFKRDKFIFTDYSLFYCSNCQITFM